MNRTTSLLLTLALALLPLAATAERYDGSTPLICSLDDTVDCEDQHNYCNQGDAASVNLPPLIRVDFKKKQIQPLGGQDDSGSPIRSIEKMDGRLILQGAQNGRGWSLVITRDAGAATVAVAGGAHGFLIFGSCTPDD